MALADNTAKINALIERINALPEAGSGEPVLQKKTVTPAEEAQTVTADEGYDGLSSVAVGAISETYVGSGVTRKDAATYTPGTSDQSISAGQYLSGEQTIKGDSDLTAQNIKSGVNIFGVTGEYEGEAPVLQEKTVTPGESAQTVTPDSGYDGLSQVTVAGDADLIAENIKSGVSIFDVLGTFEGEGGGLPEGVSALASGTVTPASNVTSPLAISHGLGVAPNFIVWFLDEDLSASTLSSAAVIGATLIKKTKNSASSTSVMNVHYSIEGYNASGSFAGTRGTLSNNNYATTDEISMHVTSTYQLIAGKTYRWACGVLDGIS